MALAAVSSKNKMAEQVNLEIGWLL